MIYCIMHMYNHCSDVTLSAFYQWHSLHTYTHCFEVHYTRQEVRETSDTGDTFTYCHRPKSGHVRQERCNSLNKYITFARPWSNFFYTMWTWTWLQLKNFFLVQSVKKYYEYHVMSSLVLWHRWCRPLWG